MRRLLLTLATPVLLAAALTAAQALAAPPPAAPPPAAPPQAEPPLVPDPSDEVVNVVLRCQLDADGAPVNCSIKSEDPAGTEFAQRALAGIGQAGIHMRRKDGRSPEGDWVEIPASQDPDLGPGVESPVEAVSGAMPIARDVYPAAALAQKVGGRVVLICAVGAGDRRLTGCAVHVEAPDRGRFGEAALKMTEGLRARPGVGWTDEKGVRRLSFCIRFRPGRAGGAPFMYLYETPRPGAAPVLTREQ